MNHIQASSSPSSSLDQSILPSVVRQRAHFAAEVVRVVVEPHPNADRLEIGRVGGYTSIVPKGQLKSGDLAAYIPEQSIVPEEIIKELGLIGKLGGRGQNRVCAIPLRGTLSQGLLYPARPGWKEGQDVTAELGITKFEPPIPECMQGVVFHAGPDRSVSYDIEDIKRFPNVLIPGEEVVITEKIHGVWMQVGVMPSQLAHEKYGKLMISSKDLARRDLAFQPDAEENINNVYLRASRQFRISDKISKVFGSLIDSGIPVFLFGEVFGHSVQDLAYGADAAFDHRMGFRVFDIYVGASRLGRFLNDAELEDACLSLHLPRVPVLYRGPYSADMVPQLTAGKETVSGSAIHLREGIVIRPQIERADPEIDRVQLKSIAADYLMRPNGSEFR